MSTGRNAADTEDMIPISELGLSTLENIREVITLSEEAQRYLNAMPWCRTIIDGWLSKAWGYILGVFYFHFTPSSPGLPDIVWIIVGDIPPAYLSVDYGSSAEEVVAGYVSEMQEWIDRVMNDLPIDETVIPVNVPAEKCWAEKLQTRLNLIRIHILDTTQ